MMPDRRGLRRVVQCFPFLLVALLVSSGRAAPVADLDGDGRITAGDVFVFASHWMTDSAEADLVAPAGMVDDHDLLELVRQFRMRDALPTPTPSGMLPAPVWTHPGESGGVYLTLEAVEDAMFLDWSDVPGAAAYEVIMNATPLNFGSPYQTKWRVDVTATPGVPMSNSAMDEGSIAPDDELVMIRVRALAPITTPTPGAASAGRSFFLMFWTASPTPTPTIRPTVDIDLNGDLATDKRDILYLQRAWMTRLGQQPHYDPAVAALAPPATEVDADDLVAFEQEFQRQRIPLPAPRLLSPASGAVFSASEFLIEGLTYSWEPVETFGGTRYTFKLMGPFEPPEYYRESDMLIVDATEFTRVFLHMPELGRPRSEYRWTVVAESKYGIKISSTPAPPNVFYVDQSW